MRTGSDGSPLFGVFTKGVKEITSRFVYVNDWGTGNIAPDTPHYLSWSPDSQKLGIIAQTARAGLSLFVHDVGDSAQPNPLINGGPLYFSWSHDSRFLLAHSFQSHYMADLSDRERIPKQLPGVSTLYMAPSWSSLTHRMAMCRDIGSNLQTLMIGDVRSARVRAVAQIEGATSFSWSPDGKSIAFLKDLNRRSGYYSGLWVADVESLELRKVSEDPVLCFFWSPNSDKIAYITPSDGADGSIRWAAVEPAGDGIVYLADFRPSQQQLITFMFFDQYGQSCSPWAADCASLVLCGELGYQLIRTELPQGEQNGVFVLDASGGEPPKEIARGSFATWSPV
jgi:Tol biopolymer transport system component